MPGIGAVRGGRTARPAEPHGVPRPCRKPILAAASRSFSGHHEQAVAHPRFCPPGFRGRGAEANSTPSARASRLATIDAVLPDICGILARQALSDRGRARLFDAGMQIPAHALSDGCAWRDDQSVRPRLRRRRSRRHGLADSRNAGAASGARARAGADADDLARRRRASPNPAEPRAALERVLETLRRVASLRRSPRWNSNSISSIARAANRGAPQPPLYPRSGVRETRHPSTASTISTATPLFSRRVRRGRAACRACRSARRARNMRRDSSKRISATRAMRALPPITRSS